SEALIMALAVAVGCGGYIYHGFARVIFLTHHDGLPFSLLTVLPTAGIAAILLGQNVVSSADMSLAFSLNGLMCGLVAYASVHVVVERGGGATPGWFSILMKQSSHSFVLSIVI